MKKLTEITIEEKLNYIREHRGHFAINCLGSDKYTLDFGEANGSMRRIIDHDINSLINRAYVVVEIEVQSWGY